MLTFLEAWNRIKGIKEEIDDSAVNAIQTGLNVSETFWDDFILVCNNKEGMANLLNVDTGKIASWPAIIQEKLEKVKAEPGEEKTKILNTGDENAD